MASWARTDSQFGFVYAMEGHTVWKQTAIFPQPQLMMEAERETEAGLATRLPAAFRGALFLSSAASFV